MPITKTEDGMQFPAAAYAYVPDGQKPSSWKLPLWETPEKKETRAQVGRAIAAIGKGFRGKKADIPPAALAAVKKRIRGAWSKVHPGRAADEMPAAIREAEQNAGGTAILQEYIDNRGVAVSVDAEAGLVRGVKILGPVSSNGREYPKITMARAVPLYEGAKVNIDHPARDPSQPRSYRDRIGSLQAVHLRGGDEGLFADLHFNPKHPLAEQLIWDAEHAPGSAGFSHTIQAKTSRRNGREIVEEIERVLSVDLVADPATTRSLFESGDQETTEQDQEEAMELTLETLRSDHSELVEAIRAEAVSEQEADSAVKKLTAQNAELRAELKRLSEARDAMTAELAEQKATAANQQRQAAIEALLREAKLPEDVLSEQHVQGMEVEAAKALIERVLAAYQTGSAKPRSKEQHATNAGAEMTNAEFVAAIT